MILSADAGSPPRVLAVVDWELSTIGHPMSDLANLCLPYHLGELGVMASYPSYDVGDGGVPTEEEVHRAYCTAAKVPFPVRSWSFYVAFSCFRLSVIIQGVAMRAVRGQASAGFGADQVQFIDQGAQRMCDRALEIMSQ